ncbi:uncharacterized protein LOC100829886 [Brachypodium distachyon]|uniref:Alpha-L-arabinofuranosidase B arabinose-binding domain-containing protein n=1 Tax=Brachypodium distachyon TaxID=15368 RepID=I1GXB3_BRADI|nr:uncharacterized protein LOC100829886 [Brachypodium distachyon]KQK17676.1 hypothetical protein BRADI_1g36027v3 [Brachypodium distachyon]|eukprot:XP_003563628.2 uncharacterized protein LOC100829886 [Brachypodium distachyon]
MARRGLPLPAPLVMPALSLALALAMAVAKECTNVPTQLSSHTVRARLQGDPSAEEWRLRALFHDHAHVSPTDEATWMDLRAPLASSAATEESGWAMLYRALKGSASGGSASAAAGFLEEVPLQDVRLDMEEDAVYGRAQQTNLEYLLLLDVDRLLWSFRTQAGLPAPGKPYGGWEGADVELRGHFVGHYLSAAAKTWASTHNGTLAAKMSAVVDALHECQQAAAANGGNGYLSAFPAEFFDRFEAIQPVWAPYYTVHKIMQGLLDQHTVAGNGKALAMAVAMAGYFGGRVRSVIQRHGIERHWTSLNEETGGMNDVLYQLYTITNDQRHLVLAHLFDKPCFLGLLAVQADSLTGFHANTHIPVVVGGQMRYEVTGDPLYKEISTFFMDIVNTSHSYATGGTSVSEFWSDPKRLASTLTTENEESCTTYNMLKVSRHLFRWTKEIAYADYYERALINGVLSIQRGRDPGVMIYMLPQGPGRSKAVSYHGWGTQYDSFWCCYGTGIESFSKLGDTIYFEEKGSKPTLYVVQYIPSIFNWKSAGLTVTQRLKPLSSSDQYLQVSLSISAKTNGQYATVNVRIPSWASANGAKATLNDKYLQLGSPGTFLTVTKQWNSGDHLTLQLPINLRTEAIKDDRAEFASLQAVLFGPFLLAGLSTGDWDAKTGAAAAAISDWISPVPSSYSSQLVTLTQESGGSTFVLSTVNGTSLAMQPRPEGGGTEAAVHGTFRLVPQGFSPPPTTNRRHGAPTNLASAMIEPFDLPGMAITDALTVVRSEEKSSGSLLFNVVPGLDGKPGSVSLELGTRPGCFVVTAGAKVQVGCGAGFSQAAASFARAEPLRRYHPISFVARGARRGFLLEPLFTLRDEFYTVYFNLGA